MKKLLLSSLSVLLLTACQKNITNEHLTPPVTTENLETAAKGSAKKIDICHRQGNGSYQMININIDALPAHLTHGDIMPDADYDGYTKVNPCGVGSQDDCNDNNPAINPGVTEVCGNNIDDNCNGQVDENCLAIGDEYQGGIIAYIYQSGDPGYILGETHGLIAATSDQGTSIEWGGFGTDILALPDVLTLDGANADWNGASNTAAIVNQLGAGNYGAKICDELVQGVYYDWYLPSAAELNKLFLNQVAIGGFDSSSPYWSSTEYIGAAGAWYQNFGNGSQGPTFKAGKQHIRAIRAF